MNDKLLEKYTIEPAKKTGPYLTDLVKARLAKSHKKRGKTTHFSEQVDKIVYGIK